MKRLILSLILFLVCSPAWAQELLEFTAEWCAPCQQMKPVVASVRKAGYQVTEVNVDRQRGLASRYGISAVPTFIMVDDDGNELSRKSGLLIASQLIAMFPAKSSGVVVGNDAVRDAVCRVKVPDRDGMTSMGSGSLIEKDGENGWVITNWHVCKDWNGIGQIVVEFKDGHRSSALLLGSDETWDLALLKVLAPDTKPLSIRETAPQPGETLSIHGFGKGSYLSQKGVLKGYTAVEQSTVEFLQIDTVAREGDSGGPITDRNGQLCGVLWGSSKQYRFTSGVYCGRVKAFVTQCREGWIFNRQPPREFRNVGPPSQSPPTYQQPPQTKQPEQPQQPAPNKPYCDCGPHFNKIQESIDRMEQIISGLQNDKPEAKPAEPTPIDPPKVIPGPAGPQGPAGKDGKDCEIDLDALAAKVAERVGCKCEPTPMPSKERHIVIVADQSASGWNRLSDEINRAKEAYSGIRIASPPKFSVPLPQIVAYENGVPVKVISGSRDVSEALVRVARGEMVFFKD